jgi:hypothetical protein
MLSINQPAQVGPLPPHLDNQRRPECIHQAIERRYGHASEVRALDPGNGIPRDSRSVPEVGLAPSPAHAQSTQRPGDVGSHGTRVIKLTLPATYWRVRRCKSLLGRGAADYPWPMPPLTYDSLVELARKANGETLKTVTGKKFTVGIARTGEIFFTPASSGYGQSDGRRAAERFLARFNESGSLRPGDYADVSRNASYLIGLLMHGRE